MSSLPRTLRLSLAPVVAVLLGVTWRLVGSPVASAQLPLNRPCAAPDSYVFVEIQTHRLMLCRAGRLERTYTVSLGRGGVGKRASGDNRTPVGDFALGQPRPSTNFHIFIPVGYPNAEQRRAGFTGGDIGIHGPKKGWAWLGSLLNLRDWTRGCIAVNQISEIEEISSWITRSGAARIELR